jgi:hypothetical protein
MYIYMPEVARRSRNMLLWIKIVIEVVLDPIVTLFIKL